MSPHTPSLRIALIWNGTVYQERTYTRLAKPVVTVGDHAKNDFVIAVDGLPDRFELFCRVNEGFQVNLPDSVGGQIHTSDETLDAHEARARVQSGRDLVVGPGEWGVLELGDVSLLFHFVDSDVLAPKLPPWAVFGLTAAVALCITASAGLQGLFLLACELMYQPEAARATYVMPDKFAKFIAPDAPDIVEDDEQETDLQEDSSAKRAEGEEGTFGKEESDTPESKLPKTDGELAEKVDVKTLGIHKALGAAQLGRGPLKNVFGELDGFSAKFDNVAIGGEGDVLVVGRGNGGMSLRGTGTGGGGKGKGRVAALGHFESGGGKGVRAKSGRKKPKPVKIRMSRGAPRVGGFCDKSNIRDVVSRGSSSIRYCYEKELQTKPSLTGKVNLQWTIGLDGRVIKAFVAGSTLNNRSAESCMVRMAKRFRFQKPKGGMCQIAYPFTFKGS